MESAIIELRLGGSALNTITKAVTPAEAILLQLNNGEGSIFNININGSVNFTEKEERERLLLTYGREWLDKCYPGQTRIPLTFVEAGFEFEKPEKPEKAKKIKEINDN